MAATFRPQLVDQRSSEVPGAAGIRMGRLRRALMAGAASALILAGCGSGSPTAGTDEAGTGEDERSPSAGAASSGPQAGGTIHVLANAERFDQLDPQRIYTGDDMAFFGATLQRSLLQYSYSSDASEAWTLVPDLATDTGTTEGGTSWSFGLRTDARWQGGDPITCQDIAYGVSRTFATDVISDGPTYQIQYLDIPADGYPGPYRATPEQQALFDAAVVCDDDANTITFHLNQPVVDFNYTATLGFSPVPKGADTGETYGTAEHYVSSGPYMIEEYTTGVGHRMVLVRNPEYDPASDASGRLALPDHWEVDFGLPPKVIDQRLIGSRGDDAFAIGRYKLQPESLAIVFAEPGTPHPEFEGRATSVYDAFARYYAVNVKRVPNLLHRQAMAVALNRAAIRLNNGGAFAGDLGDGLIKPNTGPDYAPTGWADDLFGQPVPPEGDPAFARRLIEQSGETPPALTFDYPTIAPTEDQEAAIVIDSLGRAGFHVAANPIDPGSYFSTVFDPELAHEIMWSGWGPDWPNASTITPPLFTPSGGFDLSQVDDPAWIDRVIDALRTLDRAEQASKWQALNTEAMRNVYAIPTTFSLTQRLAGTKVAPAYYWAPWGAWPYGVMGVTE